MSRFLKLLSILAIVALIAIPAFAEVQNVKVSGDINTKAINRAQYDFSSGSAQTLGAPVSYKDDDTWLMTVTSVQIDADLTDNVSTCVKLLNERDWDQEASSTSDPTTDISLDVSYVTLKEMFFAPLTLKIGRQPIRLGNGLVVGDPDTNDSVSSMVAAQSTTTDTNVVATTHGITAIDLSARKAFDAIRATLDYNPLTVDLIYAKIDANNIGRGTATTTLKDDVNLYAVNAGYKFDSMNAETEVYYVAKIDNSDSSTATKQLIDKTYVYGIRGSLEPISKLVLDAELAIQKGDYAELTNNKTIDRDAWAADIGGAYAIDFTWSPKVGVRYSYRSGQKSPGADANMDTSAATTEYKAWSTMFEDQTHGIIANKIFDGNNDGVDSNSHIFNLNASVVPLQDLTVSLDYYHFLLDDKFYSNNTAGSVLVGRYLNNGIPYEMKDKKELGDEIDLSLAYDYTEDVKLGLTAGLFLPGSAFQSTNDNMARTIMADVSVSF